LKNPGFSDGLLTDLARLLTSLKDGFFRFAPQLVTALVIFLAGWLLAHLGRWVFSRMAAAVGRYLASHQQQPASNLARGLVPAATVAGQIVYWFILFIFVAAAADRLGLSVVADWMTLVSMYAPRFFAALLIVFVGWQAAELTRQLMDSSAKVSALPYAAVLTDLLRWAIHIMTALVAIHQLGIDVGVVSDLLLVLLAVFSGGAALALALGFRQTAENVMGAFHFKKTMQPGQHLKVGDIDGVITRITGTEVFIETDQGEWRIPGSHFSLQASLKVKKKP
jgi:hypothetical protein